MFSKYIDTNVNIKLPCSIDLRSDKKVDYVNNYVNIIKVVVGVGVGVI